MALRVLGLADALRKYGDSLAALLDEPIKVGFDYAFVLVEDGAVAGHVAFVVNERKLAVHSWRSWSKDRRGAAMLYQAARRWAKAAGFERAYIEVMADRPELSARYRQLGWEPYSETLCIEV